MSPRDIRVAFGKRVRELRMGLGLSQEELAGLHRNYEVMLNLVEIG